VTQTPAPAPGDDEAEPIVVVVGRTIGGILLVIVGLVLAVAGAFVYFVTPWIAPWTNDGSIWWILSDLDFVGAIVGVLGLVGAFIGGGLVQRARRRKMQMFMDSADLANVKSAMSIDLSRDDTAQPPAGERPRTIL
jgi:hypothetical protein